MCLLGCHQPSKAQSTTNRTMALASSRAAGESPRPQRATPVPHDIFENRRGLVRWLLSSFQFMHPPLQVPVLSQRIYPSGCYRPKMLARIGCSPIAKVCQREVLARRPEVYPYFLDCVRLGIAHLRTARGTTGDSGPILLAGASASKARSHDHPWVTTNHSTALASSRAARDMVEQSPAVNPNPLPKQRPRSRLSPGAWVACGAILATAHSQPRVASSYAVSFIMPSERRPYAGSRLQTERGSPPLEPGLPADAARRPAGE
jgi:hypothetical protein